MRASRAKDRYKYLHCPSVSFLLQDKGSETQTHGAAPPASSRRGWGRLNLQGEAEQDHEQQQQQSG